MYAKSLKILLIPKFAKVNVCKNLYFSAIFMKTEKLGKRTFSCSIPAFNQCSFKLKHVMTESWYLKIATNNDINALKTFPFAKTNVHEN